MLGSNLQQDWVVLYVGSGLASSLLRCSVISDLRKGFSVSVHFSVPDFYFKVQLYYEDAVCMATGRFFQSVVPAIAKARSPWCFSLDLGTDKDLSGSAALCRCNNSVR